MGNVMRQVDEYLHEFREGDRDTAFFGLLEMGPVVLPELVATFRKEQDSSVREFLVEIIWQFRDLSTVYFLGEALYDVNCVVWKQALDGLVTLASQEALILLQSARSRPFSSQSEAVEYRRYIDEAIEQVEEKVQGF
jgi:hypothetical protein